MAHAGGPLPMLLFGQKTVDLKPPSPSGKHRASTFEVVKACSRTLAKATINIFKLLNTLSRTHWICEDVCFLVAQNRNIIRVSFLRGLVTYKGTLNQKQGKKGNHWASKVLREASWRSFGSRL